MSTQVYEFHADRISQSEIIIPVDGNAYLLKVPVIPWGYLAKVLVQQSAGTPVAFTVDALSSNVGLTPGALNPASLPAGWQQYRVLSQLSVLAGAQAAKFKSLGYLYRNSDGPDPVRSGLNASGLGKGFTNAPRYLYILLQPAAGAGVNSKWEVAVTVGTDVGT